jgi:hypothetical protein
MKLCSSSFFSARLMQQIAILNIIMILYVDSGMLNFVCSNFVEVFSHRNVFLLHNHVSWGWGDVPLCRGCTIVRGTDLCWQWWYVHKSPDARLHAFVSLSPAGALVRALNAHAIAESPAGALVRALNAHALAESLILIFGSLVANLFLGSTAPVCQLQLCHARCP